MITLPDDLRALTLIQPMGWAIVARHKKIENRPMDLPRAMRGVRTVVAVHNGAKYDDGYGMMVRELTGVVPSPTPAAIIGVMTLTGRVFVFRASLERSHHAHVSELSAAQRAWFSGPFAYEIDPAQTVALPRPIRCHGMQGWWRTNAPPSRRRPRPTASPSLRDAIALQLEEIAA